MGLLLALVLNASALLITSYLIQGFHVQGFTAAILAAIILGVVNTFIRPFLAFITAPINFLTLGLFTFVVNAIMLSLTSWLVNTVSPNSFVIDDFWAVMLGAIVLAVVSTILSMLFKSITGGVKKGKR